jgi:hypothetical protein
MHDYASQTANLSPPLRTQPRLEQLGERFEKSLMELQDLQSRLCNVADRVLGPVPEAVGKDKGDAPSSTAVGKLETMTEAFGHLLRRLRQTTDRLETL